MSSGGTAALKREMAPSPFASLSTLARPCLSPRPRAALFGLPPAPSVAAVRSFHPLRTSTSAVRGAALRDAERFVSSRSRGRAGLDDALRSQPWARWARLLRSDRSNLNAEARWTGLSMRVSGLGRNARTYSPATTNDVAPHRHLQRSPRLQFLFKKETSAAGACLAAGLSHSQPLLSFTGESTSTPQQSTPNSPQTVAAAAAANRVGLSLASTALSPSTLATFSATPSTSTSSPFSASAARASPSPSSSAASTANETNTKADPPGGKAVAPAPKSPRICLVNTKTGAKGELKPVQSGRVGMYVCGVTVYDFSHIGHARVYVTFDALYRYLTHLSFDVTYVRNFTDVDDKILKRAAECGEDPLALSSRFVEEFHRDMDSLGCLPPTVEPKVSDHIPDIIEFIERILERGHGYVVEGGDVFFAVESSASYGELSGRRLEENRAGERVEVDGRKRNPADFALWKSSKDGESLSWPSPWGRGRPGWHIECSAMSARYLGFQLDIHGGGQDLVFPHHENELAQSKAVCPECTVACWLHNGFVTLDSQKMSKSLGNFFTIREILRSYHPIALRWFLLGTHYRSPINFSQRQLAEATDRVWYVFQTLSSAHAAVSNAEKEESSRAMASSNETEAAGEDGETAHSASASASLATKGRKVPRGGAGSKPSKAALAAAAIVDTDAWAALADDFHTGMALATLSEPLRLLSEAVSTKKKKAPLDLSSLCLLLDSVTRLVGALGFPCATSDCEKLLIEMRAVALRRAGLTAEGLEARMEARAQARRAKDFAQSDRVRDELAALGILLMDGPEGQQWMPSASAALKVTDSAAEKDASSVGPAGAETQSLELGAVKAQ